MNKKQNLTDYIDTTSALLDEHSRDASVFCVRPSGIIYPESIEDIIDVVKIAQTEKVQDGNISLSIRAGGTCMSGGSLSNGYMLNLTKHMNSVAIDPETMTATVEAGAYLHDIEAKALEHGLMFASYPSSRKVCGIGGMIGNNASGEKSVRYGATIDNVLSLDVVLASGKLISTGPKMISEATSDEELALRDLYKVHGDALSSINGAVAKVASGYRLDRVINGETFDLTPIFIGAQGTLGVVVSAVIKLIPISKYDELVVVPINSIKQLPFVLQKAIDMDPESVETFDKNTFASARIHMKEQADKVAPYFSENTEAMILISFNKNSAKDTMLQAEKYVETLSENDITAVHITDNDLESTFWEIRRSSYTLVRDHHTDHMRAVPCIEDVIVPLSEFDTFITELVTILDNHSINYAYHGHIGDGSLRVIPLFNFDDSNVAEKILSLTADVFVLVKKLGGNISSDHSDGIIRSPFIREFYGDELYSAFVSVKNIFDPKNIFNPGKKIGSSKENVIKFLDNK